jgi:hypothetical protein
MANLVDENGVSKTPEELAAEALADTEIIVTFDQNVDNDLDTVARYDNRNLLVKTHSPEKLWNKMAETWRNDAIVGLIKAKAKIINDGIEAAELLDEKTKVYVQYLVSTGMTLTEAKKRARSK